ncbi:MAG: IS110 family transposase [Acidimicrobiales bacterium]
MRLSFPRSRTGRASRCFVPDEQMRHVRDLARARFDLVADRSRVKQRVEKVLEEKRW